jgi:hypothetical protein
MYCPKCGTQNPNDGKFCRSCGVDISAVPAALSGNLSPISAELGLDPGTAQIHHEARRRSDPNEVYGDSIKNSITGFGFLVVSMALLMTGVAGGKAWWWAMLFPAFAFLARGVSDMLKSRKMERSRGIGGNAEQRGLPASDAQQSLPSAAAGFQMPETRFKTGDLFPPSVTDGTTKLLELGNEGETRVLKKDV